MSDPREIVEKAIREREQAQLEMEKQEKIRQAAERSRKKSAAKKPAEKAISEPVSDEFSDALSPEVRELAEREAGGVSRAAFEIRETQEKVGARQVQAALEAEERWYQENVAEPAEKAAQERKAAAESLKIQGRDVEAGLAYGGFMATKAIKGAVEQITFPFRPKAWEKAGQQASDIFTDKPVQTQSDQAFGAYEAQQVGTRELVWEGIISDPGGFVAEAAGGLLGGHLFAKGTGKAWDILTDTRRVKTTQLQKLELSDVEGVKPGELVTEIKPKVGSRVSRVPSWGVEHVDDLEADTLLGTAEGQGFKISLSSKNIDKLFKGKKVQVGTVKGELLGVPDEYKPVAGLEDVTTGFMKDKTLKTFSQTKGSQLFKELGADSPFGPEPPKTTLNIESPFTVKVSGMAKLIEDLPEETFTPPQGVKSPWTLGEKLKEGRLFWESRGQAYRAAEVSEDAMKNLFGGGEAAKILTKETGETTGTVPAVRVTQGPEPTGWWTGVGGALDIETGRSPLFDERMKQFGGTKGKTGSSLIDITEIQGKQETKLFERGATRGKPAQDPFQGPDVNRRPVEITVIIPDVDIIEDPKQTLFTEPRQKKAPIQITELDQTTRTPPPPFILRTTTKTPPPFAPRAARR